MYVERRALSHVDVWQRYDAVEARLTASLSERMLDLAGLFRGARVLDLATGRGEPAVRAALRVGPGGSVVGVEPSAALLAMARESAESAGVDNLELRVARAETVDLRGDSPFHAVTSRWGLMYLEDPVQALINARHALAPGGAVVAAVWAEPERVPYYTLPRGLLARYRPVPAIDRSAPGTFRYADVAQLYGDFERAGLVVDRVEEIELSVFESETADELVSWVRALGLTPLLADLPHATQVAWERDLVEALDRERDGPYALGGVTRIVRARVR